MMKYSEKVVVFLKSHKIYKRNYLHTCILQKGYISVDDFYKLPRHDKIENWQSLNILTLNLFLNEKEIYETIEDVEEGVSTFWDELKIKYLLASQPRENIGKFIDEVCYLIKEFDLELTYSNKKTSVEELEEIMNKMADELDNNDTPAGSEILDYLISLEYPKR